MAIIAIRNLADFPHEVPFLMPAARVVIGHGKTVHVEESHVDPAWLAVAESASWIRIDRKPGETPAPIEPPAPAPVAPPTPEPVDLERKGLLDAAASMGKTIDPTWTNAQILEALTS
jgi:hypothetical protein